MAPAAIVLLSEVFTALAKSSNKEFNFCIPASIRQACKLETLVLMALLAGAACWGEAGEAGEAGQLPVTRGGGGSHQAS